MSASTCDFDPPEVDQLGRKRFICRICGRATSWLLPEVQRHMRFCRVPGWGDRLAELLQPVASMLKLPRCSGCGSRRDMLNRWGRTISRLFTRRPAAASPDPAILRRNLLYHVAPLTSNNGWRSNVARLLAHADAFNGRRLIAIATGEGMHPPELVQQAFGPGAWEFLPVPNDRRLREVASFRLLLERIASVRSDEASFYAHTKGNSTALNALGALYWRNAMYDQLLRRWPECMEQLQAHTFVGTHKMVWPVGVQSPFPTKLTLDQQIGRWMHAGTFYWFRHDQVFSTPRWRQIPVDRYGAEAWPSIVCPDPRLAKSMYQLWAEDVYPGANPYDPAIYPEPIASEEELVDAGFPPRHVVIRRAVEAAQGVPGMMPHKDLVRIAELAADMPLGSLWVEVGSWAGRSLTATGLALPRGRIVSVESGLGVGAPLSLETWQRLEATCEALRALGHEVKLEKRDSYLASRPIRNGQADAVFIDAGHSEEEFRRDVEIWLPKLKEDGMACGHDYAADFPGVVKVVDEYFPDRVVVGTIWSARKRAAV